MPSNRCVTCGIPVKYLFTEYGQDNFVLEICSNCKKFTDPYIEQSSIILILDLFLLKPQVYYHLLFNTNHSYQSFNSQLPSPPVPPATSIQDDANPSRSEPAGHGNLKVFNRVHLKLSFLIYGLILILESSFQALDDLYPGDLFLNSNPIKRILLKLLGLLFHIFNLIFTAAIISRFVNCGGRYHCQDPNKQDILNSIRAIIISFSPGIVLYVTIMIFQNSYGTRPPPQLFSPAQNIYSSKLVHAVRTHLGYDISGMFDEIAGIDMDQLGSTKLKQYLIRNFLGSLSCSVGIAVSYGQSWTFGFVVLCCCSIQERLLTSLFHPLDFLAHL
ncbi:hypothetical protein PTTG_05950 [Puccinia triticina 1-1 BBBD Race 1]|uniref:Protein ARV n=2 Tax=Puccinia triticina TaxID=208348 RepID=A0A0C4EYP8_PUCT1|nr:uncharacterized protein PtA15_9A155 [Puccinia triticina]OAW00112.1 hypothetical protein PTTG_05950 [Puccinia triticina 1-1 BBBD Race 1]WAQ88030.1 hypothetical protein PtA15_9A155 [Puccinia triticina]WAR60226.1 hypothetical protein PtB15_9B163 [Puccinia triticina]